jgi:hypothetical protein
MIGFNKDKNGDYVSKCAMFKIAAINNDKYLPMVKEINGHPLRVVYTGLTEDFVSLAGACRAIDRARTD